MTRGQLVAELLDLWEGSAKRLEAEKSDKVAREVRTAISVLEQTYTSEEMGITSNMTYQENED
jgi:hypothetical protein